MHVFNIEEYLYSMMKNLLGIYTVQFAHSQHSAETCWQTGRELCQHSPGRFGARQYYPLVHLIPILTSTTSPVVIISLSYPITQSTLPLQKIFFVSILYFQKWNQKKLLIWWWTEKSSLQNIEATALCVLKIKNTATLHLDWLRYKKEMGRVDLGRHTHTCAMLRTIFFTIN